MIPQERIQKVLSHAGVASRREAERLLADGRIRVNGEVVRRLGTRVGPGDRLEVDGRRVRAPTSFHYLLMNKPRQAMTTRSDPQGRRTVMDLLPPLPVRVFPVGRLDYASEGLLLFTNDGDLAQALMRPAGHVTKTYRVKVRGLPEATTLERLRRPFRLEGRPTQPAEVRLLRADRNAQLAISIAEGRRNQVREMLRRVGHPVMRLKRIAYGPISDDRLRSGAVRSLRPSEVERLRRAVGAAAPRASRRPA